METCITWVFGAPAAGKETFIRTLTNNPNDELLQRLNWKDRKIVACYESLYWVAKYPDDPLGEKRKELTSVIDRLSRECPGALILVKGQNLDFNYNSLKTAAETLPEALHRIIFLTCSAEEMHERWKKKPWYRTGFSIDTVKHQVWYQATLLSDLKGRFPITCLNGGTGQNYADSVFPN